MIDARANSVKGREQLSYLTAVSLLLKVSNVGRTKQVLISLGAKHNMYSARDRFVLHSLRQLPSNNVTTLRIQNIIIIHVDVELH